MTEMLVLRIVVILYWVAKTRPQSALLSNIVKAGRMFVTRRALAVFVSK